MIDDLDSVLARAEERFAALRATYATRTAVLRSTCDLVSRDDAATLAAQQALDRELRIRPDLEREERSAWVALENWKRHRWDRMGED